MPLPPDLIARLSAARSGPDVEQRRFRAGFRRTARGSLSGEFDRYRVTVFARRDPDGDAGDAPRYG